MSSDRHRRTRWPRIQAKREENFHFLNCQRFLFPIENFHFLICTDVHIGYASKPSGRVRLLRARLHGGLLGQGKAQSLLEGNFPPLGGARGKGGGGWPQPGGFQILNTFAPILCKVSS